MPAARERRQLLQAPRAPNGTHQPHLIHQHSALVVQNKGGGHGELGYHLCLTLADKYGLEVTMVHDGGPDAKVSARPPRQPPPPPPPPPAAVAR